MPTNFYIYFLTALIPLLVGAVYYNDKVFGTAWMNANKFKKEDLEGGNMALIFGLTYLFGLMLSLMLTFICIHQANIYGMMMPDIAEAGSQAQTDFNNLMGVYGNRFRTFSHGVAHAILATVLLVLPLIAINALFERRGWKYIMIHTGYWLIVFVLICGVLCQTLQWAPLS